MSFVIGQLECVDEVLAVQFFYCAVKFQQSISNGFLSPLFQHDIWDLVSKNPSQQSGFLAKVADSLQDVLTRGAELRSSECPPVETFKPRF